MNLFYESYPTSIILNGETFNINTDFREIIRLIDMLKDDDIGPQEKIYFIQQYFNPEPADLELAIEALAEFISMSVFEINEHDEAYIEEGCCRKNLFSFQIDYPYIFSAFLRDYQINLRQIPYMHWWEFKMLFDGLSDDTEIKQRIAYRSVNLNDIKDDCERRRIAKIQRSIMLPEERLTDYDIGDALW